MTPPAWPFPGTEACRGPHGRTPQPGLAQITAVRCSPPGGTGSSSGSGPQTLPSSLGRRPSLRLRLPASPGPGRGPAGPRCRLGAALSLPRRCAGSTVGTAQGGGRGMRGQTALATTGGRRRCPWPVLTLFTLCRPRQPRSSSSSSSGGAVSASSSAAEPSPPPHVSQSLCRGCSVGQSPPAPDLRSFPGPALGESSWPGAQVSSTARCPPVPAQPHCLRGTHPSSTCFSTMGLSYPTA